ncbi:PAS-domain containing protein [Pseudomonas corrugata]|uniref:hybrid sensor histidine kinase/response regulator NahK/ErcS' n=1 Tax=Pseudomonas corrugata TaxID=47879 RepID=UPI001E5E5801|nr:hybrid sensor histidine kinase/response regulator NahK/ErcS' [Pseudomonas corrugata]MDU9022879.1 hybrid sensor histidine kinase/response regulator NahK/ErcS' [Pseudomonas corrugata]MDU9032040.1 hybrid sensor histidine kinase/response regulator NahK/ErcS' [Pseudomonas corrugata]MDU9040067.1 hybrid sensor histidine kinase/response regulator NahK/ErcS' [Pseudomonas corrugata]UZD92671.1 PAS-domain containing protein [Pseudomonas corrugata]
MACISTRPLPELPLPDIASPAIADLQAQIAGLQHENHKLQRINAALIERVESGVTRGSDPYAAFQHSVVLAEQVRERTDALNQAMAELKAGNHLLGEARLRAETAHRYLIDAIESISDAFVLFDAQQRIVLFNSRFKAFWAHSRVRIMAGMRLGEVKRLMTANGLFSEENRGQDDEHVLYRLQNGRWLQVSERPTQEGGRVILFTDITDVKLSETVRREQAIAQKSHLLQRAVDNLSQGVAMVNAQGVLELWNRRFLELSGLAPVAAHRPFNEVIADSELQLLTPASRDSNGRLIHEREQRLSDGRVLEIRTHPLPTGGYVNTFTDITERYQHAEALSESERWIRLITDHVPALIAYLNADLVYEFTNKVYEQWYCWPRGVMLGQSLREAHSEQHYQRLEAYVARALAGESVTFEFAETNINNQERYMLRSYVPNRLANGEVVGIFVLIRDITERRRTAEALHQAYQNLEQRVQERTAELTTLNEQLLREIDERSRVELRLREAKREAEQANLSKTKFLAAVSHDLLQPLNAARLFTSALLERREPVANAHLVRNVSNSLQDVENLLGTLVDISKLDAGVIKADIAPFALSELLGNLAAEYAQVARSEGLVLRFVPCSVLVRSDMQLLARILRNLLSNAIRYTPSGRLVLGCRRQGQRVSIQVWDSGIGIAEDRLEEIFQEFKRGDVQRPDQDRGLGLGLAIVEKIAGILGHRIQVRSWPGKGSMFAIDVPLSATAPKPVPCVDMSEPMLERLRGARIWVLDNDAAICAGMRTLLEGWGCHVVTALSEQDLARQVDNEHTEVDLLIADYHLDNDQNGVDAVARINAGRESAIPAMLITANYSNELKQQIRERGHTLMHKPVRPMKLKIAMSHLLGQSNRP